jgi:hypothetical protein
MDEETPNLNNANNLIVSDHLSSSSEKSSGTEGSFFDEEDKNLIEKKVVNNKKGVINNKTSFTNKFEFIKTSNCIYNLYCENIKSILLMNIFSIILFLLAFVVKLIYQLFISKKIVSHYYMLLISLILIPFLFFTLIRMIILFKNLESKDDVNVNKDLIRLIKQKWNIYFAISLFLLTLNVMMKFILIDILHYYYKIFFILDVLIIFISSIIFGIIYYLTKSSNNILITDIIDNISFPLSISVIFAFMIVICMEQIKSFIYASPIYVFLLTCVSLLFLVYYNDILCSFLIFLYQLGGIRHISFYNMNFHTFCTLINIGFIIFMTFKNIKKYFFAPVDENVYCLVQEETNETNDNDSSDDE